MYDWPDPLPQRSKSPQQQLPGPLTYVSDIPPDDASSNSHISGMTSLGSVEQGGIPARISLQQSDSSPPDTLDRKRKAPDGAYLDPHRYPDRYNRAPSPAGSTGSASSASAGARPATFLYTLFSFLANNADSPYMRWSPDGTYFIIFDKEAVMGTIVPKLFNQKSYASFARQLNIYGWRRLQVSPCGKLSAAENNITMWQHPELTRDTPEDELKNIKRNAQDKVKPKTSISAVLPSHTSAPHTADAAPTRQRYPHTDIYAAKLSASGSEGTTRPTSTQRIAKITLGLSDASSGMKRLEIAARSSPPRELPYAHEADNRVIRPLPLRMSSQGRSASRRLYGDPGALPSPALAQASVPYTEDQKPAATMHQRTNSSSSTNSSPPGNQVQLVAKRELSRPPSQASSRASGHANRSSSALGHRKNQSSHSGFKVLPYLPSVRKQNLPQNPVDVYIARSIEDQGSCPAVIARDRLDIPIWVDDFSQTRFVLAGDIMRAWVAWEIFKSDTLLYIACADQGRPPRPIGIPAQLREAAAVDHPTMASSRERIYLEASAEAGSVGQCCLVFRMPSESPFTSVASSLQPETLFKQNTTAFEHDYDAAMDMGLYASGEQLVSARPQTGLTGSGLEQNNFAVPRSVALLPPTTPRLSFQAPMSQERGSAHEASPFTNPLETPSTADAVSSLAFMQTLAHAQAHAKNDSNTSDFGSSLPASPFRAVPSTPLDATLTQDQQHEAMEMLMSVKTEKKQDADGNVMLSDDSIMRTDQVPSSAHKGKFDLQAIEAC